MEKENRPALSSDPAPQLVADMSLYHGYSPSDNAASANRPCVVTHFQRGHKHLLYVNAAHVNGIDNPTMHTIAAAMAHYRPQAVVLESVGGMPMPQGEATFMAAEANRANIPVIAGEPSDAAIFEALKALGYSAKEVMALYLLRTIPQDRAQGMPMDDAHFAQRATDYLQHHPAFASVPPQERLRYDEFKALAAYVMPQKHFLVTETADFAPYATSDSTYFQRMHAAMAWVRETAIDQTIAAALNQYDRVLTVYGGAHLTQSLSVFEKMLGRAEEIQFAEPRTAPVQSNSAPSNLIMNITIDVSPLATPAKERGKL